MTSVPRDVGETLRVLVDRAQRDRDLPSLAAATFSAGQVVWQARVGEPADQYRIGSITKTFTAVEVMRLRDEGRLNLDDPLGTHVPDAPYGDQSVRRLLSHSSGMTAEPAGPWWERTSGGPWPELVAANAARRITAFAPGTRYHYSNLGYALLGEAVARLRGRTWFEAVHQSLLAPLGLDSTTYGPQPGAAVGTSRDPRSGQLVGEPSHDSAAMAPAGQLWSNVTDLARWTDVLAVGAEGILAPATAIEMRTAQAADPDTQHLQAYGLGLRLEWTTGGTLVGHTGSMPGFLAAVLVDPGSRVGAAVMTNATVGLQPASLARQLLETTAEALPAAVPAPDASESMPTGVMELLGDWYWGNTVMTVRAMPDGFVIDDGGSTPRFAAAGSDRYLGSSGYFAGEELLVVRRQDGSVSHLEVVTFVLTRIPYDDRVPVSGGPPTRLSSPG